MAESQFIGQGMTGGGNAKSPAQSVFAWQAAAAATKKDKTPAANGRTYAAVTAGKKKTVATVTTTAKPAPSAKLGAYVTYGDEGGGADKGLVSAMPTPSPTIGYVMMEMKKAATAAPHPPAVSVFPTVKKKSVMKKRAKTADYISLVPKKASILPSLFKKRTPSLKSKKSKKSPKLKMARSKTTKTRAASGSKSPSVVSAVKQGSSEILWPTKMKKLISESLGYKVIRSEQRKVGKSANKAAEPTKRYLLMTTTTPESPQPTVQIEEPDLQKTASTSDVHFASDAVEKAAPPPPKSTVFSIIGRRKKPKPSVFSIIPAKKNQDTVFDEIERRPEGTSKKSHHLKKSCRILIFALSIMTIGVIIFFVYFGITRFAPATMPSTDKINVSTAASSVRNVSGYQFLKTTNHSFVVTSRNTAVKAISTIVKTTKKPKK